MWELNIGEMQRIASFFHENFENAYSGNIRGISGNWKFRKYTRNINFSYQLSINIRKKIFLKFTFK